MIADAWTVMWKDWKELLRSGGGPRRGWVSLAIIIGAFGIFMPLQFGREWVETPASLLFWAWVPLFLVSSSVADSFAGERERHTLETLLASRLSDRAILLGKFSASVGYGWGLTMVSLIAGLVTVNVVHGRGQLLIFPAPILAGIFVLSLLASGLVASVGVLISLRASTVQQATQRLSLGIMLLVFAPMVVIQVLPLEWKARIGEALLHANYIGIAATASVILVVLNVIFISAAMARFQRARLILD
jgi:ABC-2 type transport system permease protein